MKRRDFLSLAAGLAAAPALWLLPWRKAAADDMAYLTPDPDIHWYLLNSEKAVLAYIGMMERLKGVSPVLGDNALCQETGTYYEEIVLDRDRPGEIWGYDDDEPPYRPRWAERFKTSGEAWTNWAGAFDRYCASHEGRIHWRIRPELVELDYPPSGEFCVYARMVIG